MTATQSSARRLRRYLGALLTLGFGVAWLALTPASKAAVPPVHTPRVAVATAKPKTVARVAEVTHTPAHRNVTLVRIAKAKPHHTKVVIAAVVPVTTTTTDLPVTTIAFTPPPVADPIATPVPDADPDDSERALSEYTKRIEIRTRSS